MLLENIEVLLMKLATLISNWQVKNRFYSILNNQRISDDEYKHANRIWKGFRLKNMGEYHDHISHLIFSY